MIKRKKRNEFRHFPKKFPKKMKIKLVGVFTAIVLAFVFLTGRAAALNLTKGDEYQKQVMSQMRSGSQTIPFKRGDILDTNGTALATSERSYNVILDVAGLLETKTTYQNKRINATVEALVSAFGLDEPELREILQDQADSRYVILKSNVDYETGRDFQSQMDQNADIVCVTLEDSYVRTYPYGTLASDVIGFTSSGNVGTIGLEAYYNSELNGTDGKRTGYLSSGSSSESVIQSPTDGNSIVTTIDANLQAIVEKHILALNERLRDNDHEGEGTKNTAVIVMDPNTGAILAEASYPNFDLNNPRDLSEYYTTEEQEAMTDEERLDTLNALWRNFCVSDTFEPGSTMKPFTMAAGFETGKLTGNETYVCTGSYSYEGVANPVSCIATNGHGTETLKQVLENSCNVGMMQIAEVLGADDFCRYQHLFGFGEYTGIDLPGEGDTSNLLYSADNMQPIDLGTNSFGQNFNVTMTQLAAGFCSLINGGNYYEPYLVKEIRNANGDVVETKTPVLARKTVSQETCDILKDYMYGVVQEGSGTSAQVEGYAIGGKTGTAEKLPRSEGKNLNSFIGYAPQENPEVMIYVIVDEPNLAQQAASYLATGLAADIMEEAFPYLNITKTE
ncbi:penicillin-binding protein 2 [Drancourtella massiliensis]|uniref:Stage V sporulation protein D n=3 Tax=Clostridia TaxID=186801 RepID=A0A9W6C7Q4_9FIRM|nr:penicillin-binding protein 2 [Sellimonas catena]MBM6743502.1 penicillin-binding protein 2 [Drancourtella massiliensis]OUN70381.1 peptidoglycan glycosyltransferase [Drancourtella sp. An57]GLG04190.1 stage V sporulation protein D [Sellimonas catena]